jgi:hypothetical protein
MSALRKLAAATALLASAHSAQAMTYQYSVEKGRLVIQAMGDVELDEARRFLDFTDALPPHLFALLYGKASLVFDSPGGNLHGGFVLANLLSGYHLTTGVARGGLCASACVVLWAAGVRKTMGEDSGIGVHSSSLGGTAIEGLDGPLAERHYTGIIADWLRRNGAPANVVAKTIETPADGMYWLTAEDLAAWRVTVVK